MIVFLHGILHFLGFLKGFGIKELKGLTIYLSRPMALLWLAASLLMVTYGIFHLRNGRYSWLVGFVAVVLSQLLIIVYWKDAKFGTIPNLLILIVCITSWGYQQFRQKVSAEETLLLSRCKITENQIVREDDLRQLPEVVKEWLRRSGQVGRPYIHVGRVTQQAYMQLKPGQKTWMAADALQYTTTDIPAFIWSVDVRMNSLLQFQGRDKFEEGRGEMLIKLNSLFKVVDERGEKLDEGTIQRFLGEMVWFPSLALSRYISWEALNERSARATISYKGCKGEGTFYYDEEGKVTKFVAMRYKGNDRDAKKQEWTMLISGYETFDGITVPASMTATWKLDEGDWTWLKLEVKDLKFNEKSITTVG